MVSLLVAQEMDLCGRRHNGAAHDMTYAQVSEKIVTWFISTAPNRAISPA